MPLLENLQQKPAGFGVDMEARSPEPEPEAFRLFPGLSLEDELRFQTYYTQPERLTELMKEPGMMMAAQFALEPGAGIKANLNRSYVGAMMGIPDGALDDVTYQFVWDGIVQHHFGRTQMSQEEFYNQTAEQFKPFDALVKSGSNPVSEVRARVLRGAAVGTSQVEAGFNGVVASLLRGERNPYMDKTTAQAQADVPLLESRIAQARAQMRELNKQHRRGFVPPQGSDMARLPELERQLGFAQLAAEGKIEENFLGSWSRSSEDLAGAHREMAQERQGWFSDEIVAAHDSWWVMRVADSVGQSAPGMMTSMMNPAFGLSLIYAQNFENASAEFEGKMREEGRSYTAEERENYAHTQSLYQTPWELVGDVAVGKAVKAIFKSIPAGTITKGPSAFGDWLGPQLKKIGESAAGEVLITTPGQTLGEAVIAEDAGVRERTTPWEKAGQTFDAMSVALGQVGGMGGGSMLVSGGVKAVKGDFLPEGGITQSPKPRLTGQQVQLVVGQQVQFLDSLKSKQNGDSAIDYLRVPLQVSDTLSGEPVEVGELRTQIREEVEGLIGNVFLDSTESAFQESTARLVLNLEKSSESSPVLKKELARRFQEGLTRRSVNIGEFKSELKMFSAGRSLDLPIASQREVMNSIVTLGDAYFSGTIADSDLPPTLQAFYRQAGLLFTDAISRSTRLRAAVLEGRGDAESLLSEVAGISSTRGVKKIHSKDKRFGEEEYTLHDGGKKEIGVIEAKEVVGKAESIAQWLKNTFRNRFFHNDILDADFTISGNSVDKMLSASAVNRSASPEAHRAALQNIEELVRVAVVKARNDRDNDPNIEAVYDMYAPLRLGGRIYRVKFKGKAFSIPGGRRLYSVEAIMIELPEAQRIETVNVTEFIP